MELQKPQDIHERIYNLILVVFGLIRAIPKTSDNLVIIGQLSRSISSMGANDQEADGAESKNDFIHKLAIVKKEAKESGYWVRLLGDLNPRFKPQTRKLVLEIEEIVKILSVIIFRTREHTKINK